MIGRGEFGDVYRGLWKKAEVAVKKFSIHGLDEFQKEIKLYQSIRHPHIV